MRGVVAGGGVSTGLSVERGEKDERKRRKRGVFKQQKEREFNVSV